VAKGHLCRCSLCGSLLKTHGRCKHIELTLSVCMPLGYPMGRHAGVSYITHGRSPPTPPALAIFQGGGGGGESCPCCWWDGCPPMKIPLCCPANAESNPADVCRGSSQWNLCSGFWPDPGFHCWVSTPPPQYPFKTQTLTACVDPQSICGCQSYRHRPRLPPIPYGVSALFYNHHM